jgi:hypothetical protein
MHRREGRDTVDIKAGTLDNTRWIVPVGHLWIRSARMSIRFHGGTAPKTPSTELQYALIRKYDEFHFCHAIQDRSESGMRGPHLSRDREQL